MLINEPPDYQQKTVTIIVVRVVTCAGTHAQLELDRIADIIDESLRGIGAVG
ncbi:MAG: hypothetical protein WCP03_02775 [Candidatus Saccharibacteria bacterium]